MDSTRRTDLKRAKRFLAIFLFSALVMQNSLAHVSGEELLTDPAETSVEAEPEADKKPEPETAAPQKSDAAEAKSGKNKKSKSSKKRKSK